MTASFTVSPTTGYSGATLAVTATGTATSWLSGTAFSVSGGTLAAVSAIAVNVGAQTATFNLYVGTAAGTLTIADSTDAATATIVISAPSFAITPTTGVSRRNPSILATGTHTSWLTTTKFTASGTGAVRMKRVDIGPQVARFHLYTGNAAATLTISNDADDSTITIVISANKNRPRRGKFLRVTQKLDAAPRPKG